MLDNIITHRSKLVKSENATGSQKAQNHDGKLKVKVGSVFQPPQTVALGKLNEHFYRVFKSKSFRYSQLFVGQHLLNGDGAYRYSLRFEFDGEGQTPKECIENACSNAKEMVNLLPFVLDEIDLTVEAFTKHFTPYCTGNRSIHVIANQTTGYTVDFERAALHFAKKLQDFGIAIDSQIYDNHLNIPLRSPYSYHDRARTYMRPVPWDMLFAGDVAEILAICKRERYQTKYTSKFCDLILDSLGYSRPPLTTCLRGTHRQDGITPLYASIANDYKLEAIKHKAEEAAKLPSMREWPDVDWAEALERASGIEVSGMNAKVIRLRECPLCGRRGHAAVGIKSGRLFCFSPSCRANAKLPPSEWARDLGIYRPERKKKIAMSLPHDLVDMESLPLPTEAQQALTDAVANAILARKGKAVVIRATPGLGKSERTLEVINEAAKDGSRIVYTVGTTELKDEMCERFCKLYGPDYAINLHPRTTENCRKYPTCEAAAKLGYLPGWTVCARCHERTLDKCSYLDQLSRARSNKGEGRIVFCCYEQAIDLHAAGKISGDIVIVDEDPRRALVFEKTIKTIRPAPSHWTSDMEKILHMALLEARGGKMQAYRRHMLYEFLEQIARDLNLDLDRAIEKAMEFWADYKPERGELASKDLSEIEKLPPAYMRKVITAMEHEYALYRQGKDFNHRVVIMGGPRQSEIIYREPRPPSFETPIFVLDAYADKSIYELLLDRSVDLRAIDARINAKVVWAKLRTSKQAFKQRQDALVKRLGQILEPYKGKKILGCTHKDYEGLLTPFCSDTLHFYQARGIDRYKDHDVAICFGTPEANPFDVYDTVSAMHWQDDEIVEMEHCDDDKRKWKDERLQRWREGLREEEICQFVHRIRGVWTEGKDKTIIVVAPIFPKQLGKPSKIIDVEQQEAEERKQQLFHAIREIAGKLGFWHDDLAIALGARCPTRRTKRDASTSCLISTVLIKEVVEAKKSLGTSAFSHFWVNKENYTQTRDAALSAFPKHRVNVRRNANVNVWGDVDKVKAFQSRLSQHVQDGVCWYCHIINTR